MEDQPKRLIDELFDAEPDKGQLTIMVGKSKKGKSYLTRYLLTDRLATGKLKWGLVFTKTKFNGDFKFLPDKRVIQGYREDTLMKYVENLKSIKEKEGTIEPNFIVFDDLVGVLANGTNWFVNWISIFRHTNTHIYICVQYLTGKNAISPIMREQTDFAIMFKSRTANTLKNLYENFGGLFPTRKEFEAHFAQATHERYSAMLYIEDIDDVEDNYMTVMAPADYDEMEFKF
jgi:hypothetical protein